MLGGQSGTTIEVEGLSHDEHLTLFTQIDSEVAVQVANLDAAPPPQALLHSDNTLCPDWAMLNSGTSITPTPRNAEEQAFQSLAFNAN